MVGRRVRSHSFLSICGKGESEERWDVKIKQKERSRGRSGGERGREDEYHVGEVRSGGWKCER